MFDFIEVYEDVLDAQTCQHMMAKFEASDKILRGRIGQGVDTVKKDSYDITITDLPEWQEELTQILETIIVYLQDYMDKYIFALVGAMSPAVRDPQTGQHVTITHENFEVYGRPVFRALIEKIYGSGPVNIQKYIRGSGGFHHWHSEIFPSARSHDALYRVLYYQIYLNAVEEGGETEFYYQKRSIQPRQGRLVIAPAGFTHTHKGHIPTSDDKFIVTSWVMFQGVGAESASTTAPPA